MFRNISALHTLQFTVQLRRKKTQRNIYKKKENGQFLSIVWNENKIKTTTAIENHLDPAKQKLKPTDCRPFSLSAKNLTVFSFIVDCESDASSTAFTKQKRITVS